MSASCKCRTIAPPQSVRLFDHLIGQRKQFIRDFGANSLSFEARDMPGISPEVSK
jgi:hypothetical protein